LSNIRVLVVDDSREMRDFVIQCVLESNGFEALEAADGAEAVRKALKGDVDLVLLDLEMPKMTGLDVLDALRARRLEVPVILMTSHGSEAIAVEVFRKGVRDYVIKPFTAEEMLAAIERAVREVRLEFEKDSLTKRLMQTNRQLEQHLRELNTFYQIGKSVTALTARDKLLERVVEAALYITGAEEGALLLTDREAGTLQECVRRRRVTGEEQRVSRRTEGELAADAVRKGDATMTAAMIYAPLKIGGRPIGALGVSNKVTARFFSDHDRRLLMVLADYAAIAIENARLLRQVEQVKEREKEQIRGVFERYVDPGVVEKLMAQPDGIALGGVRQTVTILFADIRGFSDFSAHVSPEVLVDVLNHHITVAAEAILTEGGTLDKFLGDAVMAYFNAPLPQPDHALRAVRAAWQVCRKIEESHARLPPASRLQFGVGVSTGEVVVGNIGAPQLMNFTGKSQDAPACGWGGMASGGLGAAAPTGFFLGRSPDLWSGFFTVVGDAVNVSQRLQAHAIEGQVLISQQVYGLVQEYVEAQPVGMVEIRGHAQPEPAFEVVSVKL
jgi:class 3 adenylate cyclase/DNA-binding response OmpR family regulator